MGGLSKLKELFSLVFGRVDRNAPAAKAARMVVLLSVGDPVKLDLFQENLHSNGIEFEVRNGSELFVREDERETAKAVLVEGQWEY